jgi:chorismate-pyruvate lyase
MNGPAPRRERFSEGEGDAGRARAARRLLEVLLAQDGSTTRVCEAIAGGPVSLAVPRQGVTSDVPSLVRSHLPGTDFLVRVSTLSARGEVMMDNLTYIAIDGLDPALRRGLEEGSVPIGHLLDRLWTRRRRLPGDAVAELGAILWAESGLPDARASRAYTIVTPEGPRFLIAETYRRGMLMEALGVPAGAPS